LHHEGQPEEKKNMNIQRRTILKGAAVLAGSSALGMPALAQGATKLRIGYLHTLAVDGQMWLADHLKAYAEHGIEPEFRQFQTGLELFQAMIGGSVDVLSTGAVISNFPARGQGKMFLANAVEFATAQLWVREDQGIKSLADLKGKKVATTAGTTAHVFLDTALRENGLQPTDIEILNQRMPDAVTSFISGAVPAVALWIPFNITVRDKVPGAKQLLDASAFYPKTAIISGWATTAEFHSGNREALARLVAAWAAGNEYLTSKTDEALDVLQKARYQQVPLADLKEQFAAEKAFPVAEWRKLYEDGTLTGWLQQVTDFFATTGKIASPVPAKDYFDPSIFLDATKA
jgi:NitT/TauT family transport system substrate-binding protein